MSNVRTDISENITPINFKDSVFLEKYKIESSHPVNNKQLFINTDTGEIYSATVTISEGGDGGSVETLVPFNQSMETLETIYDASQACATPILSTPSGRVDVFLNGLSIDLGIDKSAYFSNNGGVTARQRGAVELGDLLYWNGSIAGYELDTNDKVDFDYLTSDTDAGYPTILLSVTGGDWGTLTEGDHLLVPTVYEEPPLESWAYTMGATDYLRLYTSESATDLINTCQVAVDSVVDTLTVYTPIGGIAHEDKKIIDSLFKTYNVNGLTITISRGANWNSFTL